MMDIDTRLQIMWANQAITQEDLSALRALKRECDSLRKDLLARTCERDASRANTETALQEKDATIQANRSLQIAFNAEQDAKVQALQEAHVLKNKCEFYERTLSHALYWLSKFTVTHNENDVALATQMLREAHFSQVVTTPPRGCVRCSNGVPSQCKDCFEYSNFVPRAQLQGVHNMGHAPSPGAAGSQAHVAAAVHASKQFEFIGSSEGNRYEVKP